MIYHQLLARDIEDSIDVLLLCIIYMSSFNNRHNPLADGAAAFLNIQSSNDKTMRNQIRKLRYIMAA